MGRLLVLIDGTREVVRLKRLMKPHGFEVEAARGWGDALRNAISGRIDAVVVDASFLQLPTQQDNPDLRAFAEGLMCADISPPFLLMSNSPKAPSLSAQLGASRFLAKPLDMVELADALDQILPSRRRSTLHDAFDAECTPNEIEDDITHPFTVGDEMTTRQSG